MNEQKADAGAWLMFTGFMIAVVATTYAAFQTSATFGFSIIGVWLFILGLIVTKGSSSV